ncbi:MAG: recombinase family protein [Anaerolineae bacterium]
MRRVALYARVSSPHQVKEETIESQLEELHVYAEKKQYEIPSELQFVENGVTGDHLARPALDRLRDAAAAGAFQVLLLQHIDRLARNLGAQYVVLDELERAGVEVIFLNQPDLGKSPEAKLLLNVQGAFAEYERLRAQERMRRGRLYRLRHGQSVPSQAPYGYRYQPATQTQPSAWEVVQEEAVVVQQIFAWYNQGELSLGQLAERLNGQETPSPKGQKWYASTLGRMMRQPAYKGTAYYNRRQTDYSGVGQRRRQGQGILRFPRYIPRPAEEWIAISVPSLVDEATWQAAQERLEMNERFARRNSHRTYLLRGLLVCSTCGHILQGRTQGDVVYYHCTHGGVHCPPGVPRHTCSLRGDVVEPLIWQALAELLRCPERVRQAWEAFQAQQAATPHEVHRWQQRLTLLRKRRQRLLDAYEAGVLSLDELIERQNPLDIEIQQLQTSLVDAQPSAPPQIALETFTQPIEQALTASDVETRQEVIRLLIERIVVTDEALTVEHIIPTVNNSRLHTTCRNA